MSTQTNHPVILVLTAPKPAKDSDIPAAVAGATGTFGEIQFTNGRAFVSGQVFSNIGGYLKRCFSAKPLHECSAEELKASPGSDAPAASATPSMDQIRQAIAGAVAETQKAALEKQQKMEVEMARLRDELSRATKGK